MIFWSVSLAVLKNWDTVSFTVGGKEITEYRGLYITKGTYY